MPGWERGGGGYEIKKAKHFGEIRSTRNRTRTVKVFQPVVIGVMVYSQWKYEGE